MKYIVEYHEWRFHFPFIGKEMEGLGIKFNP